MNFMESTFYQGIIFGLASAFTLGSYLAPLKKAKEVEPYQFQLLMAIAILISGILITLIAQFPFRFSWFGIATGVLWAIANVFSLTAIQNLGLSKANPLWMSVAVLVAYLWGAIYFREIGNIVLGFVSIIILILGVILVSLAKQSKAHNVAKGLLFTFLAALFWGTQLVPLKLSQLSAQEFFFSNSMGVFLTGCIIYLFNFKGFVFKNVGLSLLSGVIWNLGNLLALFSVVFLGVAKGYTLTQVGVLIAVSWGLFVFKEYRGKQNLLRIFVGAILVLSGAALLILTK